MKTETEFTLDELNASTNNSENLKQLNIMKNRDTLLAELKSHGLPAIHSRKCTYCIVTQVGNYTLNISELAGTQRFVLGRLGFCKLGESMSQEEAVQYALNYFAKATQQP